MTGPGAPDVVAAGPRGGGRGWWVTALVVAGLLTFSTLRAGDEQAPAPAPSASPAPEVAFPPAPEPDLPAAPALSAPPLGGPLPVALAGEHEARRGRLRYRTGDRIAAFVPVADGYALVNAQNPQITVNPATLVIEVVSGSREIAVDDYATLFPALDAAQFWLASDLSGEAIRYSSAGRVLERVRVPGPWRPVGVTEAGLVVDNVGSAVGLYRPGRPVSVIAPTGSFVSTDGRRVLWRDGYCDTRGCTLAVTDVRTGRTWRVPDTDPDHELPRAALAPGGEAVAYVASVEGSFTVAFARRGQRSRPVVVTPPGTEAVGTFFVDWLDANRLVVFEVRDGVRPFVYDVRTGTLLAGEPIDVENPEWMYADTA